MADVLIRSFCYVLMIALGWFLKTRKIFPEGALGTLSVLVMRLTLPCAVIANFSSIAFDPSLLYLTAMGFGLNLLHIGIGFIAARGKTGSDRAFEILHHTGYNIGCFATPFVQSFLGAPGALATYTFDAGNALICTGVTYPIALAAKKSGERLSPKQFLKQAFSSMPLCAYLTMLVLSVAGIRLPGPVVTFASMVGSANAFLCMILIGVGFEIRLERRDLGVIARILATRYALAAVLALAVWFLLPFPEDIRKALMLLVFAPIPAICLIFTRRIGGNVGLSGTLSSLTILVSVLCMTVLMLLMG